jgi:2,4-dienoyl-CoA reductase-like NADH-dependent reductase (Old Yellow Enzyme family)
MCQYSSVEGFANDWHFVHLGSRAIGGAALVMTEATAVLPGGRISPEDLGLWKDEQIEILALIFRFIETQGAVPGMQLAHAGRKASMAARHGKPRNMWSRRKTAGGRSLRQVRYRFRRTILFQRNLDHSGIERVVRAFADASRRALEAGPKVIEIHAAHGYLLQSFPSPLSNQGTDEYGGSFDNRTRALREVVAAVRTVWPERFPLLVRLSATDWVEGGWDLEQSVMLAPQLQKLDVDLIDCSSGGAVPEAKIPVEPSYQVPFAERIRREAGIRTAAVGMITTSKQADQITRTGQADMVLFARELLREPYWPHRAALALNQNLSVAVQYRRAFPSAQRSAGRVSARGSRASSRDV